MSLILMPQRLTKNAHPASTIALVGRVLDAGDGVLVWFTQESGTLRGPADVLSCKFGKANSYQ
jgi:hypothetical protein